MYKMDARMQAGISCPVPHLKGDLQRQSICVPSLEDAAWTCLVSVLAAFHAALDICGGRQCNCRPRVNIVSKHSQ